MLLKSMLSVVVLTLAITAPVHAQLAVKPLFRVPGVMNYQSLGTVFSCTNTDDDPATVTVEIYDPAGALISTGTSATLLEQETSSISTRPMVFIPTTVLPGVSVGLVRGSAKLFSTSKLVMCSAFLADAGNTPPTSMVSLEVVPGKQQK